MGSKKLYILYFIYILYRYREREKERERVRVKEMNKNRVSKHIAEAMRIYEDKLCIEDKWINRMSKSEIERVTGKRE